MINKDVQKYLARKNGDKILIWSWNNPVAEHLDFILYSFLIFF